MEVSFPSFYLNCAVYAERCPAAGHCPCLAHCHILEPRLLERFPDGVGGVEGRGPSFGRYPAGGYGKLVYLDAQSVRDRNGHAFKDIKRPSAASQGGRLLFKGLELCLKLVDRVRDIHLRREKLLIRSLQRLPVRFKLAGEAQVSYIEVPCGQRK